MWPGVYIKEYMLFPLPHQRNLDAEDVGTLPPKEPRMSIDIIIFIYYDVIVLKIEGTDSSISYKYNTT